MSVVHKIGVIYREQQPEIFSPRAPEESAWDFTYLEESSLQGGPAALRPDFLAVFFPSDSSPGTRDLLARIFPSAEIIGYMNPDSPMAEGSINSHNGATIVRLPMGLPFAHFLLESIASQRAGRKEQELIHGRADDLRTLFDAFVSMVESSGSAADRAPAMNLLLHKILSRLHAEECVIYLCPAADGPPRRAYCTGNMRDLDLFESHADNRIVGGVLKDGAAHLDNRINFEVRDPFTDGVSRIRSLLCIPLLHRDQRIGVIEVLNKIGGGFTDEDQALLQMLARPLVVSINTIQMLDEAERLTVTDDLTKLYNYRYLKQYLEAEVKRCLRYKKKVSLLFIDVDGFKRVNDTFGHLVGSLALSEMGQLLHKIVRETDVVGRYGGDEFIVVLPETPLNGALVIAERIRKKIEDYEFVAQDLNIRLTVSLGIANCPKHTLTAEGLIKKADAAMYRAKEISKNSIKIAV
jgi:diguanylate cyclase (GGDEF)-like protein